MMGYREFVDEPKVNSQANGKEHAKPARFTAIRLDKIALPEGAPAIIDDVIFPGALVVVIGEPSCGKSFFVSYLAMHIAAGRSWAGKPVMGGAVVYVTCEGARGFLKRMVAFRQEMDLPPDVPFFVITDAPDLGHRDGDAETIIARIREQVGGQVALVVIDTAARVMAGADENSSTDMTTLVDNGGKIIADLGATLVFVHHVGKDASRGARGSSVLRAAADTEILIEKIETGRRAIVTKQKDAESGLTLAFDLDQVNIAGSTETSCIVTVDTWQAEGGTKRAKVSGPALVALRALENAITDHGEIPPASTLLSRTKRVVRMPFWRDACARVQITETDTPDAKRKAFTRAAQKLQDTGMIGVFEEWAWLNT